MGGFVSPASNICKFISKSITDSCLDLLQITIKLNISQSGLIGPDFQIPDFRRNNVCIYTIASLNKRIVVYTYYNKKTFLNTQSPQTPCKKALVDFTNSRKTRKFLTMNPWITKRYGIVKHYK